jgi:hypothetical protein
MNPKQKGAQKKGVHVTRSTSRVLEYVDAQFSKTQASQTKPVSEEIVVGNLTRTLSQSDHIDHMPKFMHRYIENIVDVNDDGHSM